MRTALKWLQAHFIIKHIEMSFSILKFRTQYEPERKDE